MLDKESLGLSFEPAWDVAKLFPAQGAWSEADYLNLNTKHLVEYSHGYIEVLPMATEAHQLMVLHLYRALLNFVEEHNLGIVLVAPLPMQLWAGKYREPDVLFMHHQHSDRRHKTYWQGADLVMEVVSPNNPARDREQKLFEYAKAGIPEYWLIDPINSHICVYNLVKGESYNLHGEFTIGQKATSKLLDGFAVSVEGVLGY